MGKKNTETAPALAHEEHRQGLLMHHLAWLEDDTPGQSLSLVATVLHATGPHHGSKHLVPANTGSWGHLEPCDHHPPQKSRFPWLHRARMCAMGKKSSGIKALWLPPMSNQSLQWGTGEPQQGCPLSNQPPVPPQRSTQTMGQPLSVPRPAGIPPGPKPCTAFPKISPRARVLSPRQANICTSNSLEMSFPPAATSGRAHLGPPWGHPHRGFMGKAGCWDDEHPTPWWTCPADVLQALLCIQQSRALNFRCFHLQRCGWTTHTYASVT